MNHSPGEIALLLRQHHISYVERGPDELLAQCPGHLKRKGREDSHPSWSINTTTGVHFCFSCKYRGNTYTLVRDLDGPEAAARMFRARLRHEEEDVRVPTDGFRVRRNVKMRTEVTGMKTLPESALALFTDPPVQALDQRGLKDWAVELYGVRWNERTNSWILPLREPVQDRLIGWQIKDHWRRGFHNYPLGVPKAHTLFGFHAVRNLDRVVLVESPLDAVKLFGLGYPALALCGSKVSQAQVNLLLDFGHVTLGLDQDEAGQGETQRLVRTVSGMRFDLIRYDGTAKDFGEMEQTEIEQVLAGF